MDSEFAFASGRPGSGPATWGQHKIWDVVSNLGNYAARYNVSGGTALTVALPVAQVEALVSELMLTHDSLRTTLHPSKSGLTQVAHSSGSIPVFIRSAPVDEVTPVAYSFYWELQNAPFDLSALPIRVGLVTADGLVHYVIFSLSHTACDGWGLRNLIADFVSVASGRSLDDREVTQPLEEAAFQLSPRGRRRDLAARKSWLEKLEAAPATHFPGRDGVASAFPNVVLNSPALSLGLDALAACFAVSQSSVLLAAASAVLGRLTGVNDTVFQVVVSNRFLPGMAGGVNVLANEGLFALSGVDKDFADLIRRAFGATLSTHRHAYYDKLALDRDIATSGVSGDYSCVVNDLRGLMSYIGFAKPPAEPIEELLQRTTLTWGKDGEPRENVSFAMDAQDADGSMELVLTANSAVFPRADMEQFLYGIEDLVVRHALAAEG